MYPTLCLCNLPDHLKHQNVFKEMDKRTGCLLSSRQHLNRLRVKVANIPEEDLGDFKLSLSLHYHATGVEITSTNDEKFPHVFTEGALGRTGPLKTQQQSLGDLDESGATFVDFVFGLNALSRGMIAGHDLLFDLRVTLAYEGHPWLSFVTCSFLARPRKSAPKENPDHRMWLYDRQRTGANATSKPELKRKRASQPTEDKPDEQQEQPSTDIEARVQRLGDEHAKLQRIVGELLAKNSALQRDATLQRDAAPRAASVIFVA